MSLGPRDWKTRVLCQVLSYSLVLQAGTVAAGVVPGPLPPFPPGMEGAALPQATTGSAALLPGWNLASVRNEPPDPRPAAVFSSIAGQMTRAYAWDACVPGGKWKVYDPADAGGSDLTAVDQKIGFWAEMAAAAPMPSPGTLADRTTFHLCAGWNLIGFPAEQARPVRTALSSIEGKYARIFGFDPADAVDPWELYDVSVPSWANDLDLLQPGRGYWVLATADADLVISNAGAEPEVAIASPVDLRVVTAPTDVIGTVKSDRLASWTLSYRAHEETEETVFATGTTPVVNGRLAAFDPTLLLNGGYTIELTATDLNGQIVTHSIDVNVEGQMKIGNFTLSFLDMEIPLSGLPIQVYRNYDSRDKRRGDFGVGWTLQLRQGSYQNNRKPGDGWQFATGFLPCDQIGETRAHVTTIRLSDVEVYRFKLALSRGVPTFGGCFAEARFDFVDGPVPGATLSIPGSTQVLYQDGGNVVVSPDTLDAYEPQQVRLTTRDGRIFDLDLHQGVTRIEDLNGNTLSITQGGITHSSGRSVAFQRDGLGRITGITDPEDKSTTYAYDAAGDLVAVMDRESNTTRFTYAANHHLLEIEDPLGRKPVRNEYDASGRLVRTTDAFGKSIELTHDLDADREVITDRLGHSRVLEYDERGNVVRETDALGKTTARTFDAHDLLLSESNPLAQTTRYGYDANRNLTEIEDSLGHKTRFTHNARGQVLTTTDPRGKVVADTYDAAGNLLEARDPLGHVTTYTYDAKGNRLTETDAEGAVTAFAYDIYGNQIRQTDAQGTVTALSYDSRGVLLMQTAGTLTWAYENDATGKIVKTTDPDGTSTRNVYDGLGRVVESVDKIGRSTLFTHDELGRLTRTRHPDGTAESLTYDAEGRRLTATDRGGRTTSETYDAAGRLLTTTRGDGSVTSNVYDVAGQLVATTDARGNTTAFEYDAVGRRTRVRDPLGNETVLAYDESGNQISVTDALGSTTSFEYDDANRLAALRFPDGTSTLTSHDRLGRRTAQTDQAGWITRFGYDPLGHLLTVTDALGQVTRYTYDERGNRTSQTDANGHTIHFDYDELDRMVRRTLPDGTSEEMAYDAPGRLRSRKDFAGRVTTFEYDAADRLIRRIWPDAGVVSFTYTATDRRQTVTDSRGTTAYSYDLQDRLQDLTYPDGRKLTYAYDANGNRTELTASVAGQALTTRFTYDALNRLDQVIDPRGRVYDHDYDASGNRTALRYPNGVQTTSVYDALNRLKNLTTMRAGQILQSYLYTLGPAGNRTRVDEHDGTGRSYTYDALYRLEKENVSSGAGPVYETSFDYDPVGNRLRQSHLAPQDTWAREYSYDERDRLLTEGEAVWTWDANGNLTGKSGEAAYTWDDDNRLRTVTLVDGTTVTHTYDADGNRVRTESRSPQGPPHSTDYLLDTSGALAQVVAEIDGGGNLAALYVRGDGLLAVLRSSGDRFYHTDGLGSVKSLTDDAGEIKDRYGFSAFGELLAHEGEDPNPYLFAGESLDTVSGWYGNRARWLDPRVGRFGSMDPFGGLDDWPLSLHRYLYAALSPADYTDSSGEFLDTSFALNLQANLRTKEAGVAITSLQMARAAAATMVLTFALVSALALTGGPVDEENGQENRGRIQIQGGDLQQRWGLTTPPELQWAWGPRAPQKFEALGELRSRFSLLTKAEQRRRTTALLRVERLIINGPVYAPFPRSYFDAAEAQADRYPHNTPRIDVEVLKGKAFL
jgi:RHS repeat-associated protein